MASNPKRPQYQTTIESTWGQSVADHVIRRYATAAERDADLAVIAPADLAGQYVAIVPADGSPPYLMLYDGAKWHAAPRRVLFSVPGTVSQNMPAGATTKLTTAWGLPEVNAGGGGWANAQYSPPVDGLYRVVFSLGCVVNVAGAAAMQSLIRRGAPGSGNLAMYGGVMTGGLQYGAQYVADRLVNLVRADLVEFCGVNGAGSAAVATQGRADMTYAQIELVAIAGEIGAATLGERDELDLRPAGLDDEAAAAADEAAGA